MIRVAHPPDDVYSYSLDFNTLFIFVLYQMMRKKRRSSTEKAEGTSTATSKFNEVSQLITDETVMFPDQP